MAANPSFDDVLPGTTPAAAGFAPDLGERLDAAARAGRFENLHAVVVLRAGKLVLERCYEGEDERWGRPRGRVAFGPDELHDLRSVTKSIVGWRSPGRGGSTTAAPRLCWDG